MKKQMIKKLYTYYTVKGKLEDIRNNPEHIFSSYSTGEAQCIRYHDSLTSWLEEIVANEFKSGFGLKALTEDGEYYVNDHRYNLVCYKCTCDSKPKDYIIKIMADIIDYYFNADPYYYEIESDGIYTCTELTGHMYYRSPYESCDSCGTCDGARCDTCRRRYIVKDLYLDKEYYSGFDQKEAERTKDKYKKNYSDIITDILSYYEIDTEWFKNEIGGVRDYKSLFKIINKYNIPYILL